MCPLVVSREKHVIFIQGEYATIECIFYFGFYSFIVRMWNFLSKVFDNVSLVAGPISWVHRELVNIERSNKHTS